MCWYNCLLYVADGFAGWVASTVDENQHLKIDLQNLHNVTKVILQGSGKKADAWTKQFKVLSRILYLLLIYDLK